MNWIVLGILSALLLGLYDIFRKASLNRNAVLPVLWLSTVAAAAPFVLLLAAGRISRVDGALHLLILLKAVIVATSWVLEFFALKHLQLSVAAPIRASQPFFTLLGAVTIFGERLSVGRWAGLLLTLLSYLFFSLASTRATRVRHISPWILCAMGAALVGACSSLYDKQLFHRLQIDPMAVQCWYTIYIAVLLAVIVAVFWWPRRGRTTPFRWGWGIPCIGLCLAASDTLYFHALREPEALIAMLAAIRRANVVIAFAAGMLLFQETGARRKGIALVGILAGVVLMTLA